VPYPSLLVIGGLVLGFIPDAPPVTIDPQLVLALFLPPILFDSAYSASWRDLRDNWRPILLLSVGLILITTFAVAAVVHFLIPEMPWAIAIALGAIVSPPDAAAAAAMLNRPSVPRKTATVLKGESLLNDATALMIFGVSVRLTHAGATAGSVLPQLAFAVPGGILFGILIGRLAGLLVPYLAGTLGSILFQFAVTFGVWLIADRLGLSAILAVVATAMTAAHYAAGQSARDRLHTNSVWSVVVFMLNVLAFLFVGLQARAIVRELDPMELRRALAFSFVVLAIVIVVRIVLVMTYNRAIQPLYRRLGYGPGPTIRQGVLASWCGMRGMVTLAAALALPKDFPQRGLIVLASLTVVLGTLVIQGLTLEPLVRLLGFPEDTSQREETALARAALADVAARAHAENAGGVDVHDDPALRLKMVQRQRDALLELYRANRIDEDVFRAIEQELDLEEVAATRDRPFNLVDA
jgi:Na+/H+ antiporter